MKVNDIKNGNSQRIVDYMSARSGKLTLSNEWKDKISALGIKQAQEIAKWVKSGKNMTAADILGKQQTNEASALYSDFVEANGGKINGMIKSHNLSDIRAMTSGGAKLGNKFTAAWRETYSAAFESELMRNGVESAPTSQGGFKVRDQGILDITL